MSTAAAYGGAKSGITSYCSNSWQTPQWLFDALHAEFKFTIDVAASDENHKCDRYFTKEQNGLLQSWKDETVFCNPPYEFTAEWLRKGFYASFSNASSIFLVKADTSTDWFYEWYEVANQKGDPHFVRFLKRIQFDPPPGYVGSINEKTGKVREEPGSPNMGSVLFVFRPPGSPLYIAPPFALSTTRSAPKRKTKNDR